MFCSVGRVERLCTDFVCRDRASYLSSWRDATLGAAVHVLLVYPCDTLLFVALDSQGLQHFWLVL